MIFNTGSGGNATRIVTGKSLHLADTAGGKYKNIKLVGASVQNGTPAVSKPVDIVSNKVKSITAGGYNFLKPLKQDVQTISGVTATMKDGYVVFNGTNTTSNVIDFYVYGGQGAVYENVELPVGTYTATTEKALDNGVQFFVVESTNNVVLFSLQNNVKTQTFTIKNGEKYRIFYRVSAGAILNNYAVKVSLNIGTEPLPFKPYELINTAELDETYTLNGINGVYDEIDLERGVRVQRFGVEVFNGTVAWTRESDSATFTRFIIDLDNVPHGNANERLGCFLCTHGAFSGIASANGAFIYNQNNTKGRFFIYANFNMTLNEWQSHLQANPMTLVYELAEPVETPLSVDELIAFNKLRAYKSGSTLFSGCDMEVEYFLNNKVGQPMADTHLNTAKYILDGATLNIIV